ncbi:MAG: DUF1592 domain-containing protein [Planctomycetota bacterium]|nr:DUF1592 domain-containing protein [Planctomycetota bacterium]
MFAVISLATFSLSFVANATAESGATAYQTQIRPYLSKYCFQCHGPEQQKADLRLDRLDPDMVNGSDTDMWQEVLDQTNVGEMPPAEVHQPTNQERQSMVDALTAELRQAMEAKRSTGGKNVLRRMTAYEYNNTLRDLLDLDLRYSADLPPEGVAKEGFKNNSGVLGTSALHIEYFERIARSALERIILVPETQPEPYFVRVDPQNAFESGADKANTAKNKKRNNKSIGFNLKNGPDFAPGNRAKPGLFRLEHGSQSNDGILLAGNRPSDRIGNIFAEEKKIGGAKGAGRSGWQPEFRIELYEVPHDSPVQVRIRCAAILGANHSFPRLSFELGSFRGAGVSDQKEAANEEIRSTEMQTYEFVVQGANFPFQSNKPARPSYFRIFNDYRRGTSKLSYEELPKLNIDWVEITCNYFETWPPVQRQAILFDSNNRSNEGVYVKEVLGKFMKRAYRRPVTEAEINRKVALFERLRKAEPSFEHAIVSTLTAVLCSPNFLLLSEPESTQVAENTKLEKRRIDDYELASRLSYFLWSSMPDESLFELASEGKLHQAEVLLEQTRRMLADPKSQAFSQNFADQWLDLAGIRRLAVNPEFFQFDERTKDLFEEETIRFLNHVLTENLSIRNFIASDFAVLNPKLARHYRIPDISGGFQVIPLSQDHHRGGLLTQASMLFGNSTGAETHPIKRGVWVLERMLDDPPPPPPPNVPELPEKAAKNLSLLSLKERLIAHADNATCRDCHQKIDPWGVAFENYNALGQWREGSTDPLALAPHQKVNIDPSTRLRNGTSIDNLNDLQSYLLNEKRAQFRQAVVRKVMSYSLGRYLEFADRTAIDSICETLEKNGDKFQVLIEQIVLSEPFSTK